jgi:protein required for attachment to host cells
MNHPKRWYVIADAGRASAYVRRKDTKGYDVVATWTSDLILPKNERPQFADRAGRVFDRVGSARHAAETTSPVELARKAFGRELAEALNQARQEGSFEQLVLFAAPRLLSELRRHVDELTEGVIVHSQAKDLTKLPTRGLFNIFDEFGPAVGPQSR